MSSGPAARPRSNLILRLPPRAPRPPAPSPEPGSAAPLPAPSALLPAAPETTPAPAPRPSPRIRGALLAVTAWARGDGGDAGPRGVEMLGRAGLIAYGALHLLLAGLAVTLMLGDHLVHADQQGAIAVVAHIGPVGAALLGLAIVALVAFGIWQLRAALTGFRWTSGGERLRKRFGAAAKAVAMFSIASLAFKPAIGPLRGPPPHPKPPPSAPHAVNDLVASVLALPAGRVLVGLAAAAALAVAVGMCWTGLFATFLGDLRAERLTPRWRRIAIGAGRYGNLARTTLIGCVGILSAAAAITGDPARSGDLTHAMRFIEDGPWGPAGLVVVAGGIAAFGVYCFIDDYARRT